MTPLSDFLEKKNSKSDDRTKRKEMGFRREKDEDLGFQKGWVHQLEQSRRRRRRHEEDEDLGFQKGDG